MTLSGTCLAIRNEDSCTWPAKKHKTTAMAVKDIVGCRVVEETSKKNSGRRSMSLLVTLTLTTKDDDLTEFKSVRFVFEAAEAVAFRWETEIMKSVESVGIRTRFVKLEGHWITHLDCGSGSPIELKAIRTIKSENLWGCWLQAGDIIF